MILLLLHINILVFAKIISLLMNLEDKDTMEDLKHYLFMILNTSSDAHKNTVE